MKGRLLLVATALLFSTGGAAVKGVSLTGWQVACGRSLVAALFVGLALPAARRRWRLRLLPVALAYAATLILFVQATKLTTAANAIFLQATAPLYLLVLGPAVLREPVRRADVWLTLPLALGLGLFFVGVKTPQSTAPNPVLGDLLAAFSGFTWACVVGGLRWLSREGEDASLATVVLGNVLVVAAGLPLALPLGTVTVHDALSIAWLGLFQVGLAYILMTAALRHVPAFEASTILLLEPVLNPFWSWLIHRELPSGAAVAGGALILASTFARAWWHSREPS